jgi:hypothetical protein
MGFKRVTLLLVMALAAVAFTAPATAPASGTWTHNKKKFFKDKVVKLTGSIKISTLGTGIECKVHAEAKLTAAYDGKVVKTGTGHLEKLQITTDTCVGFGSVFSGCVVDSHQVKGLKAMLTARKTDIEVGPLEIEAKFKSGCMVTEMNSTFASEVLDPDNALEASSLAVTGTGSAHTNLGTFAVTAGGALEFEAGEKKTYGVHEQTVKQEEETEHEVETLEQEFTEEEE